MYLMCTPRGEKKTSPMPAHFFISDPSKYIIQYSWSMTAGGIWTSVHSTTKSALTHQLECPFYGSSCGILVLDDLTEGEGRHDRHWT